MNRIITLLTLCFSVLLTGCTTVGSYIIKHPDLYLSEAEFVSTDPEKIGFSRQKYCDETEGACIQYLYAEPFQATDKAVFYNLHSSSNGIENKISHRMTPDTFNRYRGTAVLVHGYGGNKKVLIATAMYFRALGMKVVVPDLFGHGDSEQAFQFATKEHKVINSLIKTLKTDEPILALGHSMGALPASRLLKSEQVDAAILLAPMMRFDLAAKEYLPYKSPMLASVFTSSLSDIVTESMQDAQVTLAETDIIAPLERTKKPILLVTSDSDPVSPSPYFEAVASPKLTHLVWPKRSHSSLMLFDGKDAKILEQWLTDIAVFDNTQI